MGTKPDGTWDGADESSFGLGGMFPQQLKGQRPEYIKIGLRVFAVVKKELDDWAEIVYDKRELRLNETSRSEDPYSVAHECVHGGFYKGPYEEVVNKNEGLTEYIGDLFIQLIRDNPELVRYLQETAE